jgi:hypothetical protein
MGKTKTGKPNLRCYVCGKEIDLHEFAIVSSGVLVVDRAFFVHVGECLSEVEDDQPSVVVRSS